MIEGAEEYILAFYELPQEHWPRLRRVIVKLTRLICNGMLSRIYGIFPLLTVTCAVCGSISTRARTITFPS